VQHPTNLKRQTKKKEMTAMKTVITCSLLTIFRSRSAPILIPLLLACFALASAPTAFGVVPAPDGGYPGGNTAEGDNALLDLTTGESNTALGLDALSSNTTGSNNTATGFAVLLNNTTGFDNTGNGFQALEDNMTGSFNTANGAAALQNNTTGNFNTANGVVALFSNTTGSNNTADGTQALNRNTTGINNTADGFQTLFFNTTGFENVATGLRALFANTTGFHNTADGFEALFSNTTGNHNTADGDIALLHNTTGNFNTASGAHTLLNNTTGSFNIALGVNAGDNLTIGNNNIDIGNRGVAGESATARIGTTGIQTRTFIAGVRGVAVAGSTVVVNAGGQLGVAASSERFKDEIQPMHKASEAILALQPVTFRYKKNIDPDRVPQFGLVAEEVAKVNPDLVARDANGEVYTVRYEAVNAMLLNEFLKEHRKVQEQDVMIAQVRSTAAKQEATIAQQQKQIEALTAGLQKVSAQIEASKAPPQMVVNNR
jgi:uncharacterized coiled-coil protein SlyX